MTDDLIERLEKATGSDRELDAEIMMARYAGGKWPSGQVRRYTDTIDCALKLVPEGWRSLRFERTRSTYGCFLDGIDTNAATPAIALCIAALKAHAHGD